MSVRTRKTVARHARSASPTLLGQLTKLVAVLVVVGVVSVAGVVGFFVWDLSSNLASSAVDLEDQPDQAPALGAYEGAFNLMIVGTDECEEELREALGDRCSGPDAEGQLNDVNVLVHVSDAPRRITAISFPRDLMLAIPSCAREDGSSTSAMRKQQINAAYGHGGLSCVVDTVSQLSGLSIPFAAKVSFGNVVNITGAIGGVEVCIGNGGIRDRDTNIDWPAGTRTVQGLDALQFLRTRHGVGDQSDLARIGNQQQYLSRLIRKISSDEVLADPAAVLRLASTAVRNITPSSSLNDPLRIAQLALSLKDVPFDDITFVQYPVLEDPQNGNKVVPDLASAKILWDALAENRPLQITGKLGSNGGVVDAGRSDDIPAPVESEAAPPPAGGGSADPSAAPADESGAIALPENINGSSADQETCSAGNVRG